MWLDSLLFILFSLSVYRITTLLSEDIGPLEIFIKLRELVGVQYDEMGNPYSLNEIGNALLCFHCLSIWVAVPFAIYLGDTLAEYIVYMTGLSATAIVWRKL